MQGPEDRRACRTAAATVLLSLALGLPAAAGGSRVCPPDPAFAFPDFSDVSSLRLNGDAAQVGNVLRVAPDQPNRRGTAFLETPFAIDEFTSFSTVFRFRMSGAGADGADGLSFILQPFGADAIGTPGEGLGYESLTPSLAIELDTYRNGFDPNANHVGIQLGGNTTSVATADPGFDLEDGGVHGVWIDYDGVDDTLRVYAASDPSAKPAFPLLTLGGIDLSTRIGSSLYMGFGAATGALHNDHDVLGWNHSVCQLCAADADCDDGLFCNGAEACRGNVCVSGGDPCSGLDCDEGADVCAASPRIENGRVVAGDLPTTVALSNVYVDPVVVTTIQYSTNTVPIVSRVLNVKPTSFDVLLQNPSGAPVSPETVHWLAVERGSWTIDGVRVEAQKYLSTTTDGAGGWFGEAQSYLQGYARPVVVGQVMSFEDSNWSVFWCRGRVPTNPPGPSNLFTGKTVCEDVDPARTDETVGFVVFEEAHGVIGGAEFEAALGPATVGGVDDAPPYAYTFGTRFAGAPQVALATMNGVSVIDGGWAQIHGDEVADTQSLFLSIDEDRIADPERSHTAERVAYLAFDRTFSYEPAPCAVDADCDDGLFCNGVETCAAGYCQAGAEKCGDLTCDEDADTCDFSPLARMETVERVVGGTPETVTLSGYYVSPVVVCSARYHANASPVVTRVSNVTNTQFDVWLQNPSGTAVAAESVSCLVVEAGSWTIDDLRVDAQLVTSSITDHAASWTGVRASYGRIFSNPVVLGQVMTANDPDWSVFWCRGTARTQPPSGTALTVGKTVCEDDDVTRDTETLGVIVLEAGHGFVDGVEYEAGLGPDTVRGVDNAPPYAYDFTAAFAAAPSIAVVTLAGMDGPNGGWARIHGPTPATATRLFLSIDEDRIADAERWHVTEQVAYAVFAGELSYEPPSGCVTDHDCDDGDFCNGLEICVSGVCDVIPVDCGDDIFGP